MAIFKSKHKKNEGSASNRADATGVASPPLGAPPAAGHFGAPPPVGALQGGKPTSLNGSVGRSGIPVPGGSGLYSSAGSLGNGGGSMPPMHAPVPFASGSLPPSGMPASAPAPAPAPASSHTVLYPWSQRHVTLLPSQLLPPPSPSDSPSAPLTPLLGPPSPLPFPRYGHSVNPIATSSPSGDLYVFGGLVQNAVKNDLYVVQAAPSGASAGAGVPLPVGMIETRGEVPGPRVGHASVGVGNVLIVWGGDTKSRPEERQDDGLYLLNLSTRDWTRVKTVGRAPEGRYGHAAAMVGSRFFVFGGQTDDGGFRNDLCWFDLQKLKMGQPSWSFVEYRPGQVVPPPRTGHTCVTHGDSLYIFGGTDGQYHYNDTWQYDLSSGEWTELACIGYIPVPREGHAATLVDDVMYVFGGRGVDGKDLDDLAAFKISNHRWFMFQNMGPAPSGRSGHAMATYGSKVLVLGGESYTSTKADDPSFIHVLDTTKIKYPPDSARPAPAPPAAPERSHHPHPPPFAQQAAQQQQQQLSSSAPPSSAASGLPQPIKRKSSIPVSAGAGAEDLRMRAASPTSSQRSHTHSERGLKASHPPPGQGAAAAGGIAAAMLNGSSSPSLAAAQAPGSPTRSAGGGGGGRAPPRPARPDDAPAFGASPAPPPSAPGSERARSPEVSPPRARQASGGSADGRAPSPAEATSPGMGSLAAFAAQDAAAHAQQGQAPADAFYYREPAALDSSASAGAGEERANLERLERREVWLVEALRRAQAQGFVLESEDGGEDGEEALRNLGGEEDEKERRVKELVVAMKSELAKAKTAMAEQLASLNERFQGSDRARTAALQEASYYRAKLAALEAGAPSDVAKVERDRAAALEAQLSGALSAREALEAQVARLEADAAHHAAMRATADERGADAAKRADDAEAAHARVLAELAVLQGRAGEHERGLGEHVEKLAAVESSRSVLEGEHARLREQVGEHEQSVAHWLATLEASEAALTAAQARNDELAAAWEKATDALATQQTRVAELEHEVEALRVERDAATERADEAERMHQSTREAHDKSHALATGGLAQLLGLHRERQGMRNIGNGSGDDLAPEHAERVRAADEQVATVRQLHADAQAKHQTLSSELAAAREREAGLHVQLSTLRTQLSTVQAAHTKALDDLGAHKALVATHEGTARDVARARDAAEVKAGLLRSLLADHGLAAPSEDELASRFPTLTGSESPDQLAKRVLELEGELEARMRQKAQLEERVREHESEHGRLRDELDRAKSGGGADKERAGKAQEELEALQGRHQQLEATHLKAVQYVKGTEKMLRRMKEELTRYKERCEELESPERQAELEQLRSQVQELRTHSETSSREAEELQQRLAALQGEYQHTLRQQQDEAQGKVQELSAELDRLDAQLEKANHDLEETLVVNASLNKELQAALKGPTSPRAGGANASEDYSRLQAELEQAENKAEWLKRENATLEQRCRSAESKIAILLDHMEGVQDDHYSTNGSPHLGGVAAGGSASGHSHSSPQQHDWQQHGGAGSERAESDYEAEQPQRRA
ncbi:hypothetical protein JCM10449v2_003314 [Rhodotorula kratochvilovae]